MTQYGYEPLSPEDSGSILLERVNGVVPALLSNHKGAARPDYVQPGMMWIDDSGATWLLNVYDGANDVAFAAIDPAMHTVSLAGGTALKQAKNLSDLLDVAAARVNLGLAAGALAGKANSAEVTEGADDEKFATSAGVHSAIVAALGALKLGGVVPKATRLFSATGSYTPTPGTKFVLAIVIGGGGGSGGKISGASYPAGGYGGCGGLGIAFVPVTDEAVYAFTVGAGGSGGAKTGGSGYPGGATSLVIGGVTYSATGGSGGIGNGGAAGAPGIGSATCLFSGFSEGQFTVYAGSGTYGDGGKGNPNDNGAPGAGGCVAFLEFGA